MIVANTIAILCALGSTPHTTTPIASQPDYLRTTYQIGQIVLIYPPHVEDQFLRFVLSKVKRGTTEEDFRNLQFKEPLPQEFVILSGDLARLVIVHPETGELANLLHEIQIATFIQSLKPGQPVELDKIPADEAAALRKKLGLKPDGPKVVLPRAVIELSTPHAPTKRTSIILDGLDPERESQIRDQLVAGVTKNPHTPEPGSPQQRSPSQSSIALDVFLAGFRRSHAPARNEAMRLYSELVDDLRLKRIQAFANATENLAEGFPLGHDIPVSQLPPERQEWLRRRMRDRFIPLGFRSAEEFDNAWPNLKITTAAKLGLEYGTGTTPGFMGRPGRTTGVLVLP